MHTEFRSENLKETNHLEVLGISKRLLQQILHNGFVWIRTGTSGGLL